jgi:hypothetical protein
LKGSGEACAAEVREAAEKPRNPEKRPSRIFLIDEAEVETLEVTG